jgi:hypothetical protein
MVQTGYGTERPPTVTTAERDALSAVESDTVYNSDTKRMEFYDGTYWRGDYFVDMDFPLVQGKVGILGKPDFDYTQLGYLYPQNDPAEKLYLSRQINHDWKLGSIVYPHLHYYQTSAAVAVWKADIRITENEAAPGGFTTYTSTGLSFSYTSGTLLQIATWDSIDWAAIDSVSALVDVVLYRDDNVVTGDVLAKSFDLHILKDTPGSRQQYVK